MGSIATLNIPLFLVLQLETRGFETYVCYNYISDLQFIFDFYIASIWNVQISNKKLGLQTKILKTFHDQIRRTN